VLLAEELVQNQVHHLLLAVDVGVQDIKQWDKDLSKWILFVAIVMEQGRLLDTLACKII
jgi:hypothetical protein